MERPGWVDAYMAAVGGKLTAAELLAWDRDEDNGDDGDTEAE